MLVVYDTFTGNCKEFVNKLPEDIERCHINEYDGVSPFILVTYTFDFGNVPQSTKDFLVRHGSKIKGVASSGNLIWGSQFYCKAADIISNHYKTPILLKFELAGTRKDIMNFTNEVLRIGRMVSSEQTD